MNSIREAINKMGERNTELLQGIVISESPLKIQAVNDSKLIITAVSAIVPRYLTDYETIVDLEETADSSTVKFTVDKEGKEEIVSTEPVTAVRTRRCKLKIKVYNALKSGEKVHILSVQNGKKYFILDRV